MRSAVVYLPIRCPYCQQVTDVPYTRLEIATMLLSSEPFRLYSACHSASWIATENDRQALFALIKPPNTVDGSIGARPSVFRSFLQDHRS